MRTDSVLTVEADRQVGRRYSAYRVLIKEAKAAPTYKEYLRLVKKADAKLWAGLL